MEASIISGFGESQSRLKFRHVIRIILPSLPSLHFCVDNHSIVQHMSSRLQPHRLAKAVLSYYEDAQQSEGDHDSDTGHGHSTPNPRRGKTKPERGGFEVKQTRRRRSGRLSKFPAMPLDVMFEVRRLRPGQYLSSRSRLPRSSHCFTLGTC